MNIRGLGREGCERLSHFSELPGPWSLHCARRLLGCQLHFPCELGEEIVPRKAVDGGGP